MSSRVTVAENGRGRYQQEVVTGQHRLVADEPEAMGGNDGGPAPFDYVMAGLGACTSMTLRMYAERKGWPLGRISVDLQHEKIEVDGKPRDRIVRRIAVAGDLAPEQRARLLEIANKCPVHRALSQSFVLDSTLSPDT